MPVVEPLLEGVEVLAVEGVEAVDAEGLLAVDGVALERVAVSRGVASATRVAGFRAALRCVVDAERLAVFSRRAVVVVALLRGAEAVVLREVVRGEAVAVERDGDVVEVFERVVVSRVERSPGVDVRAASSRGVRGAGYGALTPRRLRRSAAARAMNSRVSPAG